MRRVVIVTALLFMSSAVVRTCHADDGLAPEFVHFETGQVADFEARPDDWDKAFRERGAIVRLGDGTLRLYYTGYDGTREGIKRIGLATSVDHGRSWTRAFNLPVTPEGLWVEDPCVVRHKEQWYLFAEGVGDRALMLTSPDGVRWRSGGVVDVRQTDGSPLSSGPYGTPTVLRRDDTWQLLYERRDAGIWLARSKDLKVWTNVSDDPVMVPGPTGFDSAMIALNQVVERDGLFVAYYHGADRLEKPRDWAVGVATSRDLMHWTKSKHNPITDPDENVSSGMVQFLDGPEAPPTLFTTHGTVRFHAPMALQAR